MSRYASGIRIVEQAIQADTLGNFALAVDLYSESIGQILQAVKVDPDANTR